MAKSTKERSVPRGVVSSALEAYDLRKEFDAKLLEFKREVYSVLYDISNKVDQIAKIVENFPSGKI